MTIADDLSMLHPAFLPQLVCQVLSLIPFKTGVPSQSPKIWQGGVVFKSESGCEVGLYMPGAWVAEKMKRRIEAEERRHGEPGRLQVLDLLVKGPDETETVRIMTTLLSSPTFVATEYWPSLRWSESVLLPASVKRYFSIKRKKRIPSLLLPETTATPTSFQSWSKIRQVLVDGSWTVTEKTSTTTPTSAENVFTALHLACHEGDLELLKRIAGIVNSSAAGVNGMTPVMMVCQSGCVEVLRYLIAVGCEIDLKKS